MALPNEVAPPKPPFVIKGRYTRSRVSRDGGIGRCHGAAPEHRASVSAGRCEIGGREAAGAPRTRSEAESAGAEHRASVSAGRCEIGGREAAGAPRTRSEAESAGAEHRASVSAGRCEIGGREAAGAPRTRSEAESAGAEHRASVSAGRCENRRPRSGWSPEDTERSGVRRGGTPRKR